jgi:S-layer domain protein
MKKFFRVLGGLTALSFLAAVISCGGGSTPNSPADDTLALEAAKRGIAIKYTAPDKAEHVTQDVTLLSESTSGVSVTWTSSNSEVIKIESAVGKVTSPKKDTKVTLTATLKKGKETATKTFDLTVIGTVSEQLRHIIGTVTPPKAVVYDSDPTLTLSNMVSGTTIAWTSDHPEIIKIDESGTVTVTLPAAKTAVVLTATATKEAISESKKFTVTVYPAGGTPTAEDMLSSINFTAKKASAGEQLPLPSEITGVSGTQITWASDKPQSLTVETGYSGEQATAHPDLRDITVKLTATLEYNGQTASKVFEITVERITEAPHGSSATYTFTDSTITYIHETIDHDGNHHTNGAQWAYTLDKEKRQITAYKSHLLSDDGRWIAIGSAEDKQLQKDYTEEYLTQEINEATALKTLSEKDPVTLRDCGRALGLDSSLTEEELYKELQNRQYIPHDTTYEEFAALPDDQKSTTIKQVIDSSKQMYIKRFNLSSDTDWTRILEAVNKWAQQERDSFEKEFQEWVNESKTPHVYAYSFHPFGGGQYSFETTAVYDRTKKWFEQAGRYSDNSGSYEVAFDLYNLPNAGFRYNNQGYDGTLNGDGTEFKGKNSDGEEITCNITDNKDGTLSVSIAGTSETYTLNFRGSSLW